MKDYIIDTICKYYDVPREELRMASRKREYTKARHVAFYLIRKYTDLSLSDTGRLFCRNHASVLSGEKSAASQIKLYASYRKEVETIEMTIKNALPVKGEEMAEVWGESDYFAN
jgi:chromosomal replication initiator protein